MRLIGAGVQLVAFRLILGFSPHQLAQIFRKPFWIIIAIEVARSFLELVELAFINRSG